jgi:hypothetical protein
MGFMLAWQGESFSDPIIKLAQVEDSSNTAGDGVIQPTEEPPTIITNETIREEGALKDTAVFETQLMLWAQIDPIYREQLFNAAATRASSDVLFNMGRVRAMQQVREENEQVIENEVVRLQDVAQRADAAATDAQMQAANELARAQNLAGWNYIRGGIYTDVVVDPSPDVAVVDGRLISPGRWNFGNYVWNTDYQRRSIAADEWAAGAAIESANRAAALNVEAATIAGNVEDAAAQTETRVAQLEAINEDTRVDEARLRMETEDALARAQRDLARMQQLEDALVGEYELTVPFSTVSELETTGGEAEAALQVTINAPLWRVLWAVGGDGETSSGFLVSVLDAEGKPVGGGADAISAYKRYLVFDGPGTFTVQLRGASGNRCIVVVEESEDAKLPPSEDAPPANPAESPVRKDS